MIREDFNDCPEPPRRAPKPKAGPWLPIAIVVFGGLAVAHLAGFTKPLTTLAWQWTGVGHRPGWRLAGKWDSDNDPMWRGIAFPESKNRQGGSDFYAAYSSRGIGGVDYKVESEDDDGRNLELTEYQTGSGFNLRVRYTIAADGKSMTREYTRDGKRISCLYRYVGSVTQKSK